MGEALGVSGNYIYLIEAGKKSPSKKLLAKLEQLDHEGLVGIAGEVRESNQEYQVRGLGSIRAETLKHCLELATREEDWPAVAAMAAELERREGRTP